MLALAALERAVRDLILNDTALTADPDGPADPQETASSLRWELDRVSRYVSLLADDIDSGGVRRG